MARSMNRGKQQVLFNYLPGKTFDFEKIGTIARVDSIFGHRRGDINEEFLLAAIREDAEAWDEKGRPGLEDTRLKSIHNFVFLEPQSVESSMFPLVFWCQNPACAYVFSRSKSDVPTSTICPKCEQGRIIQMPFVLVHNCGAMYPWTPPMCPTCHSDRSMALERRGERVSNFRWFCQRCRKPVKPLSKVCPQCNMHRDPNKGIRPSMDIELHRAGRTFYPRNVVVLNQPGPEMKKLLATPGWQYAAAAKYLDLPELRGLDLTDWATQVNEPSRDSGVGASRGDVTNAELDHLMQLLLAREIDGQEMERRISALRERRQHDRSQFSPPHLEAKLTAATGINQDVWVRAGNELLETVSLALSPSFRTISGNDETQPAARLCRALGISEVSVVTDFPVTTAVYGYSRCDPQPDACRLLPFSPDRRFGGALPVFTDVVEADAIMIRLDYGRVCAWLKRLGFEVPTDADELKRRAYFVSLFDRLSLRTTVGSENPQARLAFGALHTLSHLAVKQASLLCGLDRNSLAEYLLPRSLTLCIFCNHRFGSTIGALVSLFEQALKDWLESIYESHHCLYDPVCSDHGGSCHACTHLSETSCRFFNINLGRPFLFGGKDVHLGEIKSGLFEMK